ncbi:MAG: hypothetical protein HC817_03650 [Saprospiraceae bacterium]|nr:hypothetical protein [Saprospiraceae bacterium]
MKVKIFSTVLALLVTPILSFSQMVIKGDSLFGNEWIRYNQTYLKIPIAQDGIYRLTGAQLASAGIPLSIATGEKLRVFRMGREVSLFVSTKNTFSDTDFLEFYGQKNRGELDSLLYQKGEAEMLNPDFSLFNDTIGYFLTWQETASNSRVTTVANDLTNVPAKEAWFWHTEKLSFNQFFVNKDFDPSSQGVYLPEFNAGEGYGSAWSPNFSATLALPQLVNGVGGEMSVRYMTDGGYHQGEYLLNNALIWRDSLPNFDYRNLKIPLTPAQMASAMTFNAKGNYETTDYRSIGSVQIKYARSFNFDSKNYFEFNIEASNNRKYVEIERFQDANAVLWDVTNNLRLIPTLENGVLKIALPPSVSERKLVLFSSTQTPTATPKPIVFEDLTTDGGNFIFITSKRFMTPQSPLNAYIAHRSAPVGGSYRVKTVDVEQLYEQFGYGVAKNPLAIRNFIHFIKRKWASPRYITLIGRGREIDVARQNVPIDVPTWGYPGSDALLAANRTSSIPVIPIGRVAAFTFEELQIYIDKLKEHEVNQKTAPQTVEARDWYKNIMFLKRWQQRTRPD